MVLLVEHLRVGWMQGHFVQTLAVFGKFIGGEIGAHVLVEWRPAGAPIVAAVAAPGGEAHPYAGRVGRVKQDGVQAQTTVAREPLAAVRVVEQSIVDRPALATVAGLEQHGRLGAGVQHARFVRPARGNVPDLDEFFRALLNRFALGGKPGFLGCAQRAAGFRRALDGRHLARLGPGLAKVVGIVRGGTVDHVVHRRVQAPVARVVLHVHHAPALEVHIANLPVLAPGITAENEAALARTNQDFYFCVCHKPAPVP